MSKIKDGGAGALAPVRVNVPCDEFENAIRAIGVVSACEYFGHAPDSEFTKTTIEYLRTKSAATVSDAGHQAVDAEFGDVGHALVDRLRKTMTRLGVFPGEGLEWFAANLESNLYSIDRAVNTLLDSAAPFSVATVRDAASVGHGERAAFEAWFYRQRQSGRNLPKADMWEAWQARAASSGG